MTINVIPTVAGDLSNAAHVTAFESDPNAANNSSTETTTVQPSDPARADLAITAVVGPRASGQGFTYTLTVKNDGPAMATGVRLTNDLPVIRTAILGKQGQRARRFTVVFEYLDRFAPRQFLRGVDLPQIKHVTLYHPPVREAKLEEAVYVLHTFEKKPDEPRSRKSS